MHVVATAGHVDHGKSTLIRALTGIDPDRLAEEKQRGVTIDLGFAWLTLPSGRDIGIVDVPGHERFIHNMLAGAGSVAETIFVVDATEGWRPQSEEHLAILDLLGARAGVVALTKADLVDAEALDERRALIAGRLDGSTLHGSEIVAVSAVTGDGLDDLLAAVDRMLDRAGDPADRGRPRVWVDRAFSIKGAGTVVTGTLTGGSLAVGDEIEVAGERARIRGIQTHKRAVERAEPVSRVALNLGGVERAEVARGDAVVQPGAWRPAPAFDVSLRTVRSLDHALTSRGSFKCYIGTAELDATLSLYDTKEVPPGGACFARVTVPRAIPVVPGDRLVIRDAGRRTTVAGGVVLDAHRPPPRGADARSARVEELRARAAAAPAELPTLIVTQHGSVSTADLEAFAGSAEDPRDAVRAGDRWMSKPRFDEVAAAITEALSAFHDAEPLARGMPLPDLARRVPDAAAVLPLLGDVAVEGPLVRLSGHGVSYSPEHAAARAALLATFTDDAPGRALADLYAQHDATLVRAMLDAGDLARSPTDVVFPAEQVARAKRLIAAGIAAEGPLTAARIKELLGTSRKHAIPLLELLDTTGFTARRGDLRELR